MFHFTTSVAHPKNVGVITLAILFGLATVGAVPAWAEDTELIGPQGYGSDHAYAPGVGMVLLGYWEAMGYTDLIPGSADRFLNAAGIAEAIVSDEHVWDYAEYDNRRDNTIIVPDKSELGGAHANNCLADFMGSSFSSLGMVYRNTRPDRVGPGMVDYAAWRGYDFTVTGDGTSSLTWDQLTREIQFGRPVLLHGDSNGDGLLDHQGYAAAVGYRGEGATSEVMVHFLDATGHADLDWIPFAAPSVDQAWGIGAAFTVQPTGTHDSGFTASAGLWNNPDNWDNAVPDSGTFVHVPKHKSAFVFTGGQALSVMNSGTLRTMANLSLAHMQNNPTGEVLITDTGDLTVTGDLANSGIMTLAGGRLQVDGNLRGSQPMTAKAPSAITQSAGEATIGGRLYLHGRYVDGEDWMATYALDGGTLDVAEAIDIHSRFDWRAGQLTTPMVDIANNSTFAIHFDFDVGQLTNGSMGIGQFGDGKIGSSPGEVRVTGGATAVQETGEVYLPCFGVGDDDGTAGTLQVRGDATFYASRLIIRDGGRVDVDGAKLKAGDILVIGQTPETAVLEINGGSIGVGYRGDLDLRDGTVRQNGGTVRLSNLQSGDGGATTLGIYELNDGLLNTEHFWLGYANNPGKTLFIQRGGTNDTGYYPAFVAGDYRMEGGTFTGRRLDLGYLGYGTVLQTGGHVDITGIGMSGSDTYGEFSRYTMEAGIVDCETLYVGLMGEFIHTGGIVTVSDTLTIRNDQAAYRMGAGSLQTDTLLAISPFVIESAEADIRVSGLLNLRALEAIEGATIYLQGDMKIGYDPQHLIGLSYLTLLCDGDGVGMQHIEVGGKDLGAVDLGFDENFALHTLQIGGDAGLTSLQLVNAEVNSSDWGGPEAMYVENLVLMAGTSLDLNGLSLYYRTLTDYGCDITPNGGAMVLVPEPTTLALLAAGGLAIVRRRRW